MPLPDPLPQASLRDLVARSAGELDRLARLAALLDDAVGAFAVRRSGALPVQTLQEIDLLRQGVTEMAGFLGRLVPSLPDCPTIDPAPAVGPVVLRDMAQRLAGVVPTGRIVRAEPYDDRGVDLF